VTSIAFNFHTVQMSAQTCDFVIPAKAGIQERRLETTVCWIPAFAGMTALTEPYCL